jgi:hypothetical protein
MDIFCDAESYQDLTSPASARSSDAAQWQMFVKDTKMLYHSHRYKRCAMQCEKMLDDDAEQVKCPFSLEASSVLNPDLDC